MMKWIRCDERLPEKEGVFLVTVLNREWNRDRSGIEEGLKPSHDKYWEHRKNLYGQLPDGRWVETVQRVYHDGIWSGYMETVLAWMQMPRPYGVEEQLQLDLTVDVVEVVRCGECAYNCGRMDGYICCDKTQEISVWHSEDWYCADGERREE